MKKTLLLLPVLLAGFATPAVGQEVCTNQFSACVAACVKDKPQAVQDSCIEVCQTGNTACYARHNGLLPPEEVAQTPDGDALAAGQPPMPRSKPAQKRKSTPKKELQRRPASSR